MTPVQTGLLSMDAAAFICNVRCSPSSRGDAQVVHGAGKQRPPRPATPKPPGKKKNVPDTGFFAETDPKAQIYMVRSGLTQDPTKRGGRWQSDFVWNTNWKEALDYGEAVKKQVEEGKRERASGPINGEGGGKGYVSLRSKVDLNSMDVDLSAQLKPREKPKPRPPQAPRQRMPPRVAGYPAVPATRGEVRTWDRGGRYARKPIALNPTEAQEAEIAAELEAERLRYDQLKKELTSWCAGLTAACLAATFAFYGREVSASYGVGALGGILYLRLLNRSVDTVGAGGIGAAIGSNRLLIPLILTLGYNRYNLMLAEQTGLTLQLLPMLVGFFTYKGAVIARQSLVLFGDLTAPYTEGLYSMEDENEEESGQEQEGNDKSGKGPGGDGTGGGDFDVKDVDRAFNKKILMQ